MMKRTRMICLLLALVLAVSLLAVPALAAEDHVSEADALKELGLFLGTDAGYELERAPSRAEALVLLVRLLGKEAEAKAYNGDCPLADVTGRWMAPYVGWAYDQGITRGVSETAFDADGAANAKMFCAFVLRALGYDEAAGDFTYAAAADKAIELGLLAADGGEAFLRGDCVHVCYQALSSDVKGTEQSLVEKLAAEGAVSRETGERLGLLAPAVPEAPEAPADPEEAEQPAAVVKTVACAGDSLTFGLMSDDPATQSYPSVMAGLSGKYQFVTENYGLSGACVDPDDSYFFALPYDASAEFASSMETKAELVLLMLGTNDAFWSPNLDKFEENYRAMLQHYIDLPGAPQVIAVLPPHMYFEMEGPYKANLASIVEMEKKVAAEMNLPLLDAYTFTEDAEALFTDGIHFTVEGYALLAQQLYDQLSAVLDAQG